MSAFWILGLASGEAVFIGHPKRDTNCKVLILATDPEIGEQIKWNAPAFYYTGEMKSFDPKEYKRDIVVYNLHKKEYVLLVFPTGAKVNDASGLLQGNFPDGRKTITFSSLEEVGKRAKDLQAVIKKWLSLVEKD